MKLVFDDTTLDLKPNGRDYSITLDNRVVPVEILRTDAERGMLELLINGERVTAYASSDNAKRWVTGNGRTFVLTKQSGTRPGGHGHHHAVGDLTAPMRGQVRAVNVSEGDTVTKGQTLLVISLEREDVNSLKREMPTPSGDPVLWY